MVDINVSNIEQVTLIEAGGRVDGSNANELGNALNEVIDSGRTLLVLDLSAVQYMSSAGLRVLVAALQRAQGMEGDMRLAGPTERVLEVLEMTGLDTIFEIFPSRAEAAGSY